MHESWREHLEARGARFDGTNVLRFERPDRRATEPHLATTATVLAPLLDRGALAASGPDAERFLQSQLTSDVESVTCGLSQLSAYCTRQGRMLACFRLLRDADRFLLSAPSSVLGRLEEQLVHFRLRAQVAFEDAGEELVHLGLSGERSDAALAAQGLELSVDTDAVSAREGVLAVRLERAPPRYELIVAVAAVRELWDALAEHAEPVAPSAWRLLDVRAGRPWIFPETVEAFVPQMANLHALGAVSFTKGCFPGQEIVARLRYRGTLKRRMYRLRAASTPCPTPGDPVTTSNGTPIGKIVIAAPSPEDGCELLAVMTIDAAEESAADLTLSGGAPLELAALPYDVALAFEPDGAT